MILTIVWSIPTAFSLPSVLPGWSWRHMVSVFFIGPIALFQGLRFHRLLHFSLLHLATKGLGPFEWSRVIVVSRANIPAAETLTTATKRRIPIISLFEVVAMV